MRVHPLCSKNFRMPAFPNISTRMTVTVHSPTSLAICFAFMRPPRGPELSERGGIARRFGIGWRISGASRGAKTVAVGPTGCQAGTVAQGNLIIAMSAWHELANTGDIHDRRPMDADEAFGIEFLLQRLQRCADEVRCAI